MSWFVYIVECCDETLYCGITCDIARRLNEHNGSLLGGAKYTAPRRPVRLVASVEVENRAEAARIEVRIKKLPKRKKLNFIASLKQI